MTHMARLWDRDVDGTAVPDLEAFSENHRHLSQSPASPWINFVVVRNREKTGRNELKGCIFTRRDVGGEHSRILEGQREWFEILADVFYERLDDDDGRQRRALWRAVMVKHEEWLRQGKG
ncbi:hypothetical protein [Sulfobacillus harzensis]|uniref:Uncharacterized protein n=1 Tax=Sulfobacillus harzensis TaxID=2729629 RepID=A0A7Y0Q155_9FIRM|nr:hypothetical protein [Sulfobacillus harzensis]NMP21753.1 hypothetical protein [Sulfobacillus harzensis]